MNEYICVEIKVGWINMKYDIWNMLWLIENRNCKIWKLITVQAWKALGNLKKEERPELDLIGNL